MRRLRQLLRPLGRAAAAPAPFELAGRQVSELRLLGTSRVGLPSWSARLEGEPVKIYRCHSPSQARFIEHLSARPELAGRLPECRLRQRDLLVARWLPGRSLAKDAFRRRPAWVEQVARLQADLHGLEVPPEALPDAPCYRTYLEERWQRYRGILALAEAHAKLAEVLAAGPPPGRPRVSHPDVVPQNLVPDPASGRLAVIDNELLSANTYPLIDLFNSQRYFGRKSRGPLTRRYLEAYVRAGGELAPLLEAETFLLALWRLRVLGSRLQNGDLAGAQELGRWVLREREPRHELIETARRIL